MKRKKKNNLHLLVGLFIILFAIGWIYYSAYRDSLAKAKIIKENIAQKKQKLDALQKLRDKSEKCSAHFRIALAGTINVILFTNWEWAESITVNLKYLFGMIVIMMNLEKVTLRFNTFYKSITDNFSYRYFHYAPREYQLIQNEIETQEIELRQYAWALELQSKYRPVA